MTNEFVFPFQEIVNTYGIPDYKEFNPAVFTIVTFPFLFGVMFGDIGHGGVLLILSSILVLFNERLEKNPTMKLILKVRYLLLLMGFFAVYCGLIYNDFMAIPLELSSSCYDYKTGKLSDSDCIYPFGLDPIWYIAKNELSFFNSLKMKLAVLLGVA